MQQVIVHIGAPRTGTTTLQKNVFPFLQKHDLFTKTPYTAQGLFTSHRGRSEFTPAGMHSFIRSIESPDSRPSNAHISDAIRALVTSASHVNRTINVATSALLVDLIHQLRSQSAAPIFLSNERYCDSGASLNGDSRHTEDSEFGIYPLMRAIIASGVVPSVVVCLREPIAYLRSKYLRTVKQRKSRGLRFLSIKEYIEKQVFLEKTSPGTSVIAQAMHSEFLRQLQRYSFVKAFGFQDLLSSEDVFSLMGLVGEPEISLKHVSAENQLSVSGEANETAERQVVEALKVYELYEKIKSTQMHE